MALRKILAIGVDGLEVSVAEQLMAEGHMPALAELKKRSARFLLETEPSQSTGIPWEHVASGLAPKTANRWGSIQFNPATYTTWQEGAHFAPWWTQTDLRVVVFDPPYIDLRKAENTQGIAGWGAHNPGTYAASRPKGLFSEFEKKFGQYPAREWMYANPWPSAERAQLMGEALCHALQVRTRAAQWLAVKRFPEWDLFFVVVSELHGGMEGLWHGLDASHPLHSHPSAVPAARALIQIHRELDNMIGQLMAIAGDATILAFNTGGMGPNRCDVQSMVLLAELLYRNAFGTTMLTLPSDWTSASTSLPLLDENTSWETASASWVPYPERTANHRNLAGSFVHRLLRPVNTRLGGRATALLRLLGDKPAKWSESALDWMPTNRYRPYWPLMPAFALPSFADGRIRINLRGRERDGIVDLSQYEETCRRLESLLNECYDPRTGQRAVASVERASNATPLALGPSQADLRVGWRDVSAAIEHPRLGTIGPVPLHKTGHHTGPYGVAYLAAPDIEPGARAIRSAFDIPPTIAHLLGVTPTIRLSGKSLFADTD